jgi:hypothetical protein
MLNLKCSHPLLDVILHFITLVFFEKYIMQMYKII